MYTHSYTLCTLLRFHSVPRQFPCIRSVVLTPGIVFSYPLLMSQFHIHFLCWHLINSHVFFQLVYDVKKKGMMVPFKGERGLDAQFTAVNIIRWTQYISLLVFSYMFPLYVSLHRAICFSTQNPMSTCSIICYK